MEHNWQQPSKGYLSGGFDVPKMEVLVRVSESCAWFSVVGFKFGMFGS